jgi:nitroimidazol reductase NimA-like FMN-containing flavoprotein (pyridoxamine 5'-phosphate oxidase superfamily)
MRRKDREINDINRIEEIIGRCDVCRLAMCDGNTPYMVAMNFGYIRGEPSCLYFHCATAGKKLDIIRKNNNVFFQFDTDHKLVSAGEACDFTMKYSSVTGSGKIYIVDTEEERFRGLNVLMKQYSGKDDYAFKPGLMKNTLILRIDIEEMIGKVV